MKKTPAETVLFEFCITSSQIQQITSHYCNGLFLFFLHHISHVCLYHTVYVYVAVTAWLHHDGHFYGVRKISWQLYTRALRIILLKGSKKLIKNKTTCHSNSPLHHWRQFQLPLTAHTIYGHLKHCFLTMSCQLCSLSLVVSLSALLIILTCTLFIINSFKLPSQSYWSSFFLNWLMPAWLHWFCR